MAQLAESKPNPVNKQDGLCPFYGSSHGCPYLNKCELSHANPNSIQLCPNYQTSAGCPNPSSCYYRHSLAPLTSNEIQKLSTKHKIAGKIHYSRVIKGSSVHRVTIIINQVIWYAIHFIIEDARLQHIHHQKYTSVYLWNDAVLLSELIADIICKSESPGKYLSYLKNLIDGDTEPGRDKKKQKLIHYRDILTSIGNNYKEIPRPINPHLLSNLSRVPWVDFKVVPLMHEVYQYPDVYLKPGDLVRIWRPKKFVYHCAVYLGNKQIIHISNGVNGDQGMNWRFGALFQSGSTDVSSVKPKGDIHMDEGIETIDEIDADFDKIEKEDIEGYDDMDLVDDDDDSQRNDECKMIEYNTENNSGEMEEMDAKGNELLYQDLDELENKTNMNDIDMERARRARVCEWNEFVSGSRKKDLELGYFVFPWRTPAQIVYTARFLTEIHYMKGQYSVYKNNCEHFALYCCTGLRYSPQANKLERVLDIGSKIGSIAGSIWYKAVSFRKSENKENVQQEHELENEHHQNHPIIKDQELDDGGDDELEKILLNEDNENKKSPKISKKAKRKQKNKNKKCVDDDDVGDSINSGDDMSIQSTDEYANDEEDVMVENMVDLSHMTPGGLTQSEVFVAQNQHKWNI